MPEHYSAYTKGHTRREVTLGPLERALKALNDSRSENSRGELGPTIRDRVIEYICEGASLLAMVWVARQGSKDQILTYNVKSERQLKDLIDFQNKLETVSNLNSVWGGTTTQITNLNSSWTSAYHKSRIVSKTSCKTECDTQNHCHEECTITYELEHYWDEPPPITSKGLNWEKLDHWESFLKSLLATTSSLQKEGPQTFDLSKGEESVVYSSKSADSRKQTWVAIPVYSAIGAVYVFYEEVLKLSSLAYIEGKRIKRRSLLKLAAAIPLALKVRDIQKKFALQNDNLLKQTQEHTASVLSQLDVKPVDNFKRFFRIDPQGIRNTLLDMQNKCNQALNSGYSGGFFDGGWPDVKAHIELVKKETEAALINFDNYFSYNKKTGEYIIPEDLTEITSYLWATREIINYTSSRSSEVYTRHILNALALAFGLTVTAAVSEGLIKVSDQVLDKVLGHDYKTHQRSHFY
jgi:hypothetical protein